MLYYFTGYIGYAVAGAYIKRFRMQPSRSLSLAAVVLIVSGYAITASGSSAQALDRAESSRLELTWGFETINVAMITVGFFLLFKEYSAGDARQCALEASKKHVAEKLWHVPCATSSCSTRSMVC